MMQRTLAENLDALFAGRDSDSGIRDPELLQSCLNDIDALGVERYLDTLWDLSVELYGESPYGAEDRLEFIDWVCEEAGWDR